MSEFKVETSMIKEGDYLKLKNEPYHVLSVQPVVTESQAKTNIRVSSVGVFSGECVSVTLSPQDTLEVIDIDKKSAQIITKMGDNYVQAMDSISSETFNAQAPSEVAGNLNEGDEVTYIDFNGRKRIIG